MSSGMVLSKILRGGLPRRRIYLLQGSPGSGKMTLGMPSGLARKQACTRPVIERLGHSLEHGSVSDCASPGITARAAFRCACRGALPPT